MTPQSGDGLDGQRMARLDASAASAGGLGRLVDALAALEAFRRRQAAGAGESEAQFLAANPHLCDVLGAMMTDPGGTSAGESAGWPGAPAMPECGDEFGPYHVIAMLGAGGMGAVFRAEDRRLGRQVALKVITADRVRSPHLRQRFTREARAASRLAHPGICTIYEVGEIGGVPFLAMRLIEGETLAARIQRAQATLIAGEATIEELVDIDETVRCIEQVARAVHHAHTQGIVHRDIKPANIAVGEDGAPIVLDFGVASDREQDDGLTLTGERIGTLAYMSPEQVAAKGPADARADVWALGVTLYESLALERPFRGPSQHEVGSQILAETPVPLTRKVAWLRRDLAVVCERAMEKDPADRYATAADLANDLSRWLRREPIVARRPTLFVRTVRWCQRHPLASALVLVALVLTGLNAWQWVAVTRVERDLAVSRASERSVNARRAMESGRALAAHGEWRRAEEQFRLAMANGQDEVDVQLALAEIATYAMRFDEAREQLDALAERRDLGPRRAKVDLLRGDPSRHLGFASSFDPIPVERAIASGDLAPADSEYAQAVLSSTATHALQHVQAALEIEPGHRPANEMRLALVLLAEGPSAALGAIAVFEARFANDPTAALLKAACLQALGEPEHARAAVEESGLPRVLAVRFAQFRALLVAIRAWTGELDHAMKLYYVDPEHNKPSGWLQVMAIMKAVRDWREEADTIEDELPLGEQIGAEQLGLRLPPRVLQPCEVAVRDQASPFAGSNRLASATAAAAACPQAVLHVMRAFAALRSGRYDEVARAFRDAGRAPDVLGISSFANSFAIYWTLHAYHAALERGDAPVAEVLRQDGLASVRRFLAVARTDPLDLHFATRAASQLGSPELAAATALSWLGVQPGACEPLAYVAEALTDLPELDLAAGYCSVLLARWPDHPLVRAAAARNERLRAANRAAVDASANDAPSPQPK